MNDRRGPRTRSRVRATIVGWLPAIALFLAFRVAVAEAYHIPSGSMEPTLLVNDRLFVNKMRYGPHIPFTSVNLPGYAEPRRGDVVVFVSPPQDPSIRISPDEITPTLVKRIVGEPLDTLAMRNGVLYVNGVAETPGRRGDATANPEINNWGPRVVPAGHYFMMGDNRDNSIDSRYYGPVPRANIRGAPTFVYYSFDEFDGVDYFRAVTEIRWRRIGHWIR